LQVGGEQEAVTDPAPMDGVVTEQDWVHPAPTATTEGWDAVQVRGILLRTIPLFEFARELLPITSGHGRDYGLGGAFETEKSVCSDPAWPISREMFWMGPGFEEIKMMGGFFGQIRLFET